MITIKPKEVNPSECKLDTTCNWNNFCMKYANTLKCDSRITFVNVDENHWQNSEDTAVIQVAFKDITEAIEFTAHWRNAVNEFDVFRLSSKVFVMRLWWD